MASNIQEYYSAKANAKQYVRVLIRQTKGTTSRWRCALIRVQLIWNNYVITAKWNHPCFFDIILIFNKTKCCPWITIPTCDVSMEVEPEDKHLFYYLMYQNGKMSHDGEKSSTGDWWCWWWWWWWLEFYGHFCARDRLNGPSDRQRWYNEVKDETPFRYANAEARTWEVAICWLEHYAANSAWTKTPTDKLVTFNLL